MELAINQMKFMQSCNGIRVYLGAALRLSHIPQQTMAKRSTIVESPAFTKPKKKSLKLAKRTLMCGLQKPSSHQISLTLWQPQIAWTVSSISASHTSQMALLVTFLLNRFSLVGRDSLQALQIKFITLLGTFKLHIFLQKSECAAGFEFPGLRAAALFSSLLTIYKHFPSNKHLETYLSKSAHHSHSDY